MPTQLVEQGLHLVGQFGHIGKSKRRSSTLDRVSTTENGIELFVVRSFEIQIQKHLLHLIQVFSGFLKENLIKLGQIKSTTASPTTLVVRFGHS